MEENISEYTMKDLIKKTICIAVTASLCAYLAACDKDPVATTTTEETTVTTTETSATETSETTEETEETTPGPDFSTDHAYRLYAGTDDSMTLNMKIDIDDYITKTDDGEVFELFKLASDLGWREMGVYSYEDYLEAVKEDPDQKKIGHTNWFSYDFDDHRSVFIINEYIEDIPEYNRRQVSLISFEYMKNEFTLPFYDDSFSNPAHGKVQLGFDCHYDDICYYVGSQHSVCSRDDAIVIAYSLWVIANSPDDNTPVSDPFEQFRAESGVIQLP